MRKIIVLLLLCYASTAFGQQEIYLSSGKSVKSYNRKQKEKEKGFQKDKIVWGGGFGASIGSVTAISLAPVIGYRISDHFAAGIGVGYQYLKIKDYRTGSTSTGGTVNYDYKANIFSPSVWVRYKIIPNLIAHVEYEHNFYTLKDYGYDPGGSGNIVQIKDQFNVPSLLVGPGYRQPISDNASLNIVALYDVLQQPNSAYLNRIEFRVGFLVGF
jgi:hypothetical protein